MKAHRPKEEERREQERRIARALSRVKHKLLVMSGKGGVGKSTVAVNLAVALAGVGHRVGLLDVDLHGPTVPMLLGLQGERPRFKRGTMIPIPYGEHLEVVSMGNLLDRDDRALIWRGPLKIGAIRQFIADVEWGELDFLVIDSPPGTGDEPLTVAQTIPDARAVIVTTPQEVSLADVRRSIQFCREVGMPVLGLIENMAGYVCPVCGHEEALFGKGGGARVAREAKVALLGSVPVDPALVRAGDEGRPYLAENPEAPASRAFRRIVEAVEHALAARPARGPAGGKAAEHRRIAVPTAQGRLASHFGHCERMTLVDVEDGKIVGAEELTPPEHQPGVFPGWVAQQGATLVIAGGMGTRARELFAEHGVEVVVGAPPLSPEEAVLRHLRGTLPLGENRCDH